MLSAAVPDVWQLARSFRRASCGIYTRRLVTCTLRILRTGVRSPGTYSKPDLGPSAHALSGTNCMPSSVIASSYASFIIRDGSFAFSRGSFL